MDPEIKPFQACDIGFEYMDETKLMAARELATTKPLKAGLQFALRLTIPQQSEDSRSRPVPLIPGATESAVPVQLVDGIQTDPDGFSQVWTARVLDSDTVIVLKIIQPSMCRFPDYDNYTDPKELALDEESAYKALQKMQGVCVPYFFGLDTIFTPSGEGAWVLVLEYIPGETLDRVARSYGIASERNSPERAAALLHAKAAIHDSCKLGLALVEEMTRAGFLLSDVRGPNFILTGSPEKRAVVTIDFANLQCRKNLNELRSVQNFFYQFTICVGDAYPEIHRWGRDNLPAYIFAR
ncbi:hypothetical protein B0H11DRAFT_2027499 [Mycena galericulata]|nr:hypothetical protein B0H11DRAFT_2027499 [Mycena galericulata]